MSRAPCGSRVPDHEVSAEPVHGSYFGEDDVNASYLITVEGASHSVLGSMWNSQPSRD